MTCEKCGQEVQIGAWPFCPHEKVSRQEYHEDAIPGGMLVENGVPEPTIVYSHSELRRLRDKHGWQVKETWAPMPGTDKDPQGIPNPAGYMDPVTFQNGVELILRGGMRLRKNDGFEDHEPTDAELGVEKILHHTDDEVLTEGEVQKKLGAVNG